MKKLFINIASYGLLMLFVFEVLVRIFHLYDDRPVRYVDEKGILKWIPGQKGYSVHGNRRQNFAKYHINNSGFNSFREFEPSTDSIEVAIIGDSFIEGFHQDFDNSIGKKVEKQLPGVQVYEYGHSSNDLADELHLMSVNKKDFDKIDKVILYLDYEGDLDRSMYKFIERKPVLPILNYSKLYVYLKMIGFFAPIKSKTQSLVALIKNKSAKERGHEMGNHDEFFTRLGNFKSLIDEYGFDKEKIVFLLDSGKTDERFMQYLDGQGFYYLDYANSFQHSKMPTTLIYDQHWNDNGRTLLAKLISSELEKDLLTTKKQ